MSSSNHPSFNALGGRKPEPVCSEPEASDGLAKDFDGRSATTEGDTRTADRMGYDPAYLPRPELMPRIAKDHRAYTVAGAVCGLVLAISVAVIAVLNYGRLHAPAVDRVPVIADIPRVLVLDCFPMYGVRRVVVIDTQETDSDAACKREITH